MAEVTIAGGRYEQGMKPTDNETIWRWAASIMDGDGVSSRALYRIDPLTHLLAGGLYMWCSGGTALAENTITHKRCPRCMTLARQMLDDLWED